MAETRTIEDPFLGKQVEISTKLVDRLRGKYANGPTMANGEPEFGWREFPTPPIQKEAADEIDRLQKLVKAQGEEVRITRERDEALARAMWQLLDDMGVDGLCVCLQAKAEARIAFEPFEDQTAPAPMLYAEAERIMRELRVVR